MRYLLAGLLVLAACATTSPSTMPDITVSEAAPEKAPPAQSGQARLVPYPGLDVAYVANGQGEVYHCRKRFYCFFDGSWFRADTLHGPWDFVEMKYVPSDLFRARGHLPPALEQSERDENPFVRLVGGE